MGELLWGWQIWDDVGPAAWLADELAIAEPPLLVNALVPASYPAHARLVHPAYTPGGQRIRFCDIPRPDQQRWNGDPRFTDRAGGWTFGHPRDFLTPTIGSLDPDDLAALADLLAPHTSTPNTIWALMWPGWGGIAQDLGKVQHLVRASRVWERYALLRGELSSLESLARSCSNAPSYWWPKDRAWVVGTDLDVSSTYVSATRNAVDALIADERIDAHPAKVDEKAT